MSYETLPIVGMFYRPPAQILVSSLAVGTPLVLFAEPDNPADPNAVAVWLKSSEIPDSAYAFLEENLPDAGFSLDGVLAQDMWQLGYVPKEIAKQLRENDIVPLSTAIDVTFTTNAKTQPRVRFPEPVL
jgi:hypothetical protein